MGQMNRPPDVRLPLGSPVTSTEGGSGNGHDVPPYVSTSLPSSHLGSVSINENTILLNL